MTQPESRQPDQPNRRIAISGASGFLGRALATRLQRESVDDSTTPSRRPRGSSGYRLAAGCGKARRRGARRCRRAGQSCRRADRAAVDARSASGNSSTVALTATTLLSRSIAELPHPPRVFVSGSAIGIYGDRGDEELDEESRLGTDFLAEAAEAWERATEPARAAGIRVVLHSNGHRAQSARWRARENARCRSGWVSEGAIGVRLSVDELDRHSKTGCRRSNSRSLETSAGPMNLVAPNPVPNAEFATTLARVLARPALVPVPRPRDRSDLRRDGARDSARQPARPSAPSDRRLVSSSAHPTLEQALRAELAVRADDSHHRAEVALAPWRRRYSISALNRSETPGSP